VVAISASQNYLLPRNLGNPGQFLQFASQNHTPSFFLDRNTLPILLLTLMVT